MTDAGVPSPWLDEALRTLNEFVPQWARPRLWAGTPAGVIRGAYLSDPVTHPLAYHALSALMLTQVSERLNPAARGTLGETLEALACWPLPTARRITSAAAKATSGCRRRRRPR